MSQVDGNVAIIGGATILILVAGWYLTSKAEKATGAVVNGVKAVAPYINPADSRNLIYSGINAVGSVVTDDLDFSLGSWLYDVLHPKPEPQRPQDSYQIPKDFGVADPGAGW